MKFLVEDNGEIIKCFDNGTDVYIFDCVTNTITNKEDALKCAEFILTVYLKDMNYTPIGHLCDYIAERWYEGIKYKEINDILQNFYDTLY